MAKTQEQFEAEYKELEDKENSLELRRANEEEEYVRLQEAKENTDDICGQINQTDRELSKVRNDMVALADAAGWNDQEEEDDELFYAEQGGWTEGQSN